MDAPEYTFWNEIFDGIKRIFTKLVGVLSSRKFLAAIGATVVLMQSGADIPTISGGIVTIWVAFILGTALEDGLTRR